MLNYNFASKSRLRLVPIYLSDSRASETRACVKITSREKGETRWGAFLAWGDFHARSRFARSTKAEEKWGRKSRFYRGPSVLGIFSLTGTYCITCTWNTCTPEGIGKLYMTLCLILVHVSNGILLFNTIFIIIYTDGFYSPLFRDVYRGTRAIEARGFRSRLFK